MPPLLDPKSVRSQAIHKHQGCGHIDDGNAKDRKGEGQAAHLDHQADEAEQEDEHVQGAVEGILHLHICGKGLKDVIHAQMMDCEENGKQQHRQAEESKLRLYEGNPAQGAEPGCR